jgi:mannitol-1-phosphate 5-dehydrogenase
MKTAVQFGAGNIGRGFMGQLFWEAGYRTIFVDANQKPGR